MSEPSNSWIALNIIAECNNQLLNEILHVANKDKIENTQNIKCLLTHQLATITNDSHQRFILRSWFKKTLISICMTDCNYTSSQGRCNKADYRSFTKRLNILQRSAEDSVAHSLYQAMLCYKAGKYNQTLRLIELSKGKISDPASIYFGQTTENQYMRAGGDNLPIEALMRKHFLFNIAIENDMYISELYIESHGLSADFYTKKTILMSPMICALFLQYLCHKRQGCQSEADKALYEINLLVQYDDGELIRDHVRDISWQILGICQQMNGDYRAACRSYLTALQQDIGHRMKVATCVRIGTILMNYF